MSWSHGMFFSFYRFIIFASDTCPVYIGNHTSYPSFILSLCHQVRDDWLCVRASTLPIVMAKLDHSLAAGFMLLWIIVWLWDILKVVKFSPLNLWNKTYLKLQFRCTFSEMLLQLKRLFLQKSVMWIMKDAPVGSIVICCSPSGTYRRTEWPVKWVSTMSSTLPNWGIRMPYRGYYLPWVSAPPRLNFSYT